MSSIISITNLFHIFARKPCKTMRDSGGIHVIRLNTIVLFCAVRQLSLGNFIILWNSKRTPVPEIVITYCMISLYSTFYTRTVSPMPVMNQCWIDHEPVQRHMYDNEMILHWPQIVSSRHIFLGSELKDCPIDQNFRFFTLIFAFYWYWIAVLDVNAD